MSYITDAMLTEAVHLQEARFTAEDVFAILYQRHQQAYVKEMAEYADAVYPIPACHKALQERLLRLGCAETNPMRCDTVHFVRSVQT